MGQSYIFKQHSDLLIDYFYEKRWLLQLADPELPESSIVAIAQTNIVQMNYHQETHIAKVWEGTEDLDDESQVLPLRKLNDDSFIIRCAPKFC